MSKLNKTDLIAQLTLNITSLVNSTDLVAKTKKEELLTALMDAIAFAGPTAATSKKVNDEGLVFCNYFHTYLPEEEFKTKRNNKKHGKLLAQGMEYVEAEAEATGYQANSIGANLIIRKAKSMKKRLEQQAMREFRFGRLTDSELNDLLDIADSITLNKYDTPVGMPTLWDLIQPKLGDEIATSVDK